MISRFLAGPLLVVALVFTLGSPSQGQFGGFNKDPKARFDAMANGKSYIVISEVSPFFRDRLVKFAKDNGITNDKLTLEQYMTYSDQRAKEFAKKGGPDGFKKGNGADGQRSPTPAPRADAAPASAKPVEVVPSAPEFQTRIVIDGDLDRRPVVYRAGKLPAGLPEWFEKLDLDGDGQVDLGEWRKAGRPLAEFKALDVNNDGLLTPEEVLQVQARGEKAPAASAPASSSSQTSGASGSSTSGSGNTGNGDNPFSSFFRSRKKSSR